jgi:hypothetical protein
LTCAIHAALLSTSTVRHSNGVRQQRTVFDANGVRV